MSGYEVRPASSGERGWGVRWVIHRAGFPYSVVGRASTRWGSSRMARRWQRQDDRANRSYAP